MVAKSTVILSWSIRLFPAVFVYLAFQCDRGQLRNALSLDGLDAEVTLVEAVAEAAESIGSDSMVERWTESFSSTSLVVIELLTP